MRGGTGKGRTAVLMLCGAAIHPYGVAQAADAIEPAWLTHLRGMSWQVDASKQSSAQRKLELQSDSSQTASGVIRFVGGPRTSDEQPAFMQKLIDAVQRGDTPSADRLNQQFAAIQQSIQGKLAGSTTMSVLVQPPDMTCDTIPPQTMSVTYDVIGFYTADGINLSAEVKTPGRTINRTCKARGLAYTTTIPTTYAATGFGLLTLADLNVARWNAARTAPDGSFTFPIENPIDRLSGIRFSTSGTVTVRPGCSITIPAKPVAVKASGGVTLAPEVVNGLDARRLEQMAREKGEAETLLYGLTPFEFARDLPFEDSARPAQVGDGVCVSSRPEGWAIRLTGTAQIHIARELLPGSCPFRVTLVHEQRHVRATGDLLREYAHRVAKALSDTGLPTRSQEWWAPSEEAGTAMINAEIKRVAGPILAEFKRAKRASDLAIDAVDERGLCPQRDWDDIDIRYDRGHGGRPGG